MNTSDKSDEGTNVHGGLPVAVDTFLKFSKWQKNEKVEEKLKKVAFAATIFIVLTFELQIWNFVFLKISTFTIFAIFSKLKNEKNQKK